MDQCKYALRPIEAQRKEQLTVLASSEQSLRKRYSLTLRDGIGISPGFTHWENAIFPGRENDMPKGM